MPAQEDDSHVILKKDTTPFTNSPFLRDSSPQFFLILDCFIVSSTDIRHTHFFLECNKKYPIYANYDPSTGEINTYQTAWIHSVLRLTTAGSPEHTATVRGWMQLTPEQSRWINWTNMLNLPLCHFLIVSVICKRETIMRMILSWGLHIFFFFISTQICCSLCYCYWLCQCKLSQHKTSAV